MSCEATSIAAILGLGAAVLAGIKLATGWVSSKKPKQDAADVVAAYMAQQRAAKAARDAAEREHVQAKVDARLDAIDKREHPTRPDDPTEEEVQAALRQSLERKKPRDPSDL